MLKGRGEIFIRQMMQLDKSVTHDGQEACPGMGWSRFPAQYHSQCIDISLVPTPVLAGSVALECQRERDSSRENAQKMTEV